MFRGSPRKLSLIEPKLTLINPEEFDTKANLQISKLHINSNIKEQLTSDLQNISPNLLPSKEKSQFPSLNTFDNSHTTLDSKKLQIPENVKYDILEVRENIGYNINQGNADLSTNRKDNEKKIPKDYESYLRVLNPYTKADSPQVVEVKNPERFESIELKTRMKSYLRETDLSKRKLLENLCSFKESSVMLSENTNPISLRKNYIFDSVINKEDENLDPEKEYCLNSNSESFNPQNSISYCLNLNPITESLGKDKKWIIPESKDFSNQSYLISDPNSNDHNLNLKAREKSALKLPVISEFQVSKSIENDKIGNKIEPNSQIKQMQREKKLITEKKLYEITKNEKKELEKVYRCISEARKQKQIEFNVNHNPIDGPNNLMEFARNLRKKFQFQSRLRPNKISDSQTLNYNLNLNSQSVSNKQNRNIKSELNKIKELGYRNYEEFKNLNNIEEKAFPFKNPQILKLKSDVRPLMTKEDITKSQQTEERTLNKLYLKDKELKMIDNNLYVNIDPKYSQNTFNNDHLRKIITARPTDLSDEMFKMHSSFGGQIKEIELKDKKYEELKLNAEKKNSVGLSNRNGNAQEKSNNNISRGCNEPCYFDGANNEESIYNNSPSIYNAISLMSNQKKLNQRKNKCGQITPNLVSYKPIFFPFDYSIGGNSRNNPNYLKKRNTNVELNLSDKRNVLTKLDKYDTPIKERNYENIQKMNKFNKLNTNRLTTLEKYEFSKKLQNENQLNLNKEVPSNIRCDNLNSIQ